MRRAGLLAAAVVAFGTGTASADGEIRVLNWQGYGTDEAWAIEAFTAATGTTVVHDYYTSEQEMLAKLRTSPGSYDVVVINSSFTQLAAEAGLIQPIDSAAIGNWGDLTPALRDADDFVYDGAVYGVAWVWGLTSIAYDTTEVEPGTSIAILWDPAYAGNIAVRDDAVENVYLAAIATGQDMSDPQDMEAIRQKLRDLKPQIRTYWSSEDEWNKEFSADTFDVAIYWSGSASRSAKAFGLPVGYLIPEEGAIGWLDGLSIATDAPNPEGAAAFIDFMVDPDFYVRWDNEVGAPASSNAVAMSQLPEDAFNRTVLGAEGATDAIQFMGPLSDDKREEYLELWQETKAYYAE